MKRVWLILCILLWIGLPVQAQEDVPAQAEFTFSAQGAYMLAPFDFQWMPEGGSFFFHLLSVEGPVLPFFRYFVGSHQLQSTFGAPTQIVLNYEQQTAFSAYSMTAFLSPNGRYTIYTIQNTHCGEATDCSPLLGLADLETNTYTGMPKGSDTSYTVRWSADSSAFLVIDVGAYGGLGGIWYGAVDEVQHDPPGTWLKLLANYDAGSIAFVDISRDGQRVLIREMWEGFRTGLILWDARTPASPVQFIAFADGLRILGDEVVAGAGFIPGDEQHILAVLERGIVRYDLATGEIEVIDPEINVDWVDWAYFSPDARYVATYSRLRGQIAVYAMEPPE
jgi:hypothetical protein